MRLKIISLIALIAPWSAAADSLSPAIIYDVGGRLDKSFNQSAYEGVLRFEAETGLSVVGVDLAPGEDRAAILTRTAESGANFIIVVGFSFGKALGETAEAFPGHRFVSIDSVVEGGNVSSIVFKEHEGSYLAGVAAAMASESGTLGFIGGLNIPLIERFGAGFAHGARSVDPDIRVLRAFMDDSTAPFNDPFGGGLAAARMIDEGADVLYAAAGLTGLGVLQIAKLKGALAVGVDSNQNYLHPGVMLTSMVKQVGLAVERALHAARDGAWTPGVDSLGLAEAGVDIAIDAHNAGTLTPDIQIAVTSAREAIVSGRETVAEQF